MPRVELLPAKLGNPDTADLYALSGIPAGAAVSVEVLTNHAVDIYAGPVPTNEVDYFRINKEQVGLVLSGEALTVRQIDGNGAQIMVDEI